MLTQHLKAFTKIILTSEIYTGRVVKPIMSPWWFNTTYSARKLHLIRSPSHSTLTLILLMWRIWWAPNNASRWQMGFNSAFKGLTESHNRAFSYILCIFWVVYIVSGQICQSFRVWFSLHPLVKWEKEESTLVRPSKQLHSFYHRDRSILWTLLAFKPEIMDFVKNISHIYHSLFH